MVSDGNEGVIQAIEANFESSYRQRCVHHKMENVLAAVPKEAQEEVRAALNPLFFGSTSRLQNRRNQPNLVEAAERAKRNDVAATGFRRKGSLTKMSQTQFW